jgi:Cytochrome C and Quinol oxidase polypeptide I
MEAALPISAAIEPKPPRAKTLVTAAAPSISLPLRFVLTGVLALCGAISWLVVRPELLTTYHYNQHIIALTHLVVLGWISSVVMGAMYQLVPVALETRLYSERLARWQFAFHLIGFAGMVWMLQRWSLTGVGHFGSVLAVGVGLFVYNLTRTLLRAPKRDVVAAGIAASLAWLSCAVLAGLCIAGAKSFYEIPAGHAGAVQRLLSPLAAFMARFDPLSAMHAHAHLGVVGLFTMLIVGVSYKLVPMFTLSEVQNRTRARWSLVLLNAGLLGVFFAILLRSRWKFLFALVICAALAVYARELIAIVRARKRPTLDWGLKTFLTALGLLGPLCVLGCVLAWPGLPLTAFTGQLENLYGFLALMGLLSLALLGMLHKIIPFLVWLHTYSPHIGRAKVPNLAEMYSERLQAAGYWFWLAGLGMTAGGILLQNTGVTRLGAAALAAGLSLFVLNFAKMLSHALFPKVKPVSPIVPHERASRPTASAPPLPSDGRGVRGEGGANPTPTSYI